MDGARRGGVAWCGPSGAWVKSCSTAKWCSLGRSSFWMAGLGFARPWTLGARASWWASWPAGPLVRPVLRAQPALLAPRAPLARKALRALSVLRANRPCWPPRVPLARKALRALSVLRRATGPAGPSGPVGPAGGSAVTTVFGVGLDQTYSIPAWATHSILCALGLAVGAGQVVLARQEPTGVVVQAAAAAGYLSDSSPSPISPGQTTLWVNVWQVARGGAAVTTSGHERQPGGTASSDGCSVRLVTRTGLAHADHRPIPGAAAARAPPRNLLVGLAGGICIASRAQAVTPETRQAARAVRAARWWRWRWRLDHVGRDSAGGVGQGGYGFHKTSSAERRGWWW